MADYGYDLNGNLTSRVLDNSTSSSYGYDALNRCTSVSHALTGTTRTFAYGYDTPKIGNLGWVKRDSNLGDIFDYDLNDQAIQANLNIPNPDTTHVADGQNIYYDAAGNRTSFSVGTANDTYAPANNLNQYTTRNGVSAAYDPNGNMTTGFDGSIYTYDAQNRMLSAKEGGTTDTFLYDGLNRQIGKQIGSASMYYRVYDGWNLLGEYKTGTSNAFWAYLYGAGGVVKNLVTNNYYYQDASGSTSHLASSSGALLEYYRYDVQGTPIVYAPNGNVRSGGSNYSIRHLFTGQQWYSELGLYDLRNRYYSPDVGRFLQSDPAGFRGDASNLYRYCGNNPMTRSDPTGLFVYYYSGNLIDANGPYTPTGTNIPLPEGSELTSAINFPEGFSSTNGFGSVSGAAFGPGFNEFGPIPRAIPVIAPSGRVTVGPVGVVPSQNPSPHSPESTSDNSNYDVQVGQPEVIEEGPAARFPQVYNPTGEGAIHGADYSLYGPLGGGGGYYTIDLANGQSGFFVYGEFGGGIGRGATYFEGTVSGVYWIAQGAGLSINATGTLGYFAGSGLGGSISPDNGATATVINYGGTGGSFTVQRAWLLGVWGGP